MHYSFAISTHLYQHQTLYFPQILPHLVHHLQTSGHFSRCAFLTLMSSFNFIISGQTNVLHSPFSVMKSCSCCIAMLQTSHLTSEFFSNFDICFNNSKLNLWFDVRKDCKKINQKYSITLVQTVTQIQVKSI